MSVPVRYSAATVIQRDNWSGDDRCAADTDTAEVRWQRISPEGRLGTPDAAAASSSSSSSCSSSSSSTTSSACSLQYMNEHHPQDQQQQQHEHTALQQHQQFLHIQSPPSEELFAKLQEATALEMKYQPCLFLPKESHNGEITIGTRDGAAHVLRCLKVWYELPSDVLFAAINLVDRFLTKMKVKPKHMACISVGSFHLAINQLGLPNVDTEDLVAIAQCRCTSGDLERMAGIIANKLGVQMNVAPVTSLTCLRIFYHMFRNFAYEIGAGQYFDETINLTDLELRLEILLCDASCASVRATELALVLICTQFECFTNKDEPASPFNQNFIDYAIQIQNLCRISEGSMFENIGIVAEIQSRYNGQHKMPYRQRLVWKLSSRTMRVLRPTDKLTSHLPTIAEHNIAANSHFLSRFRTGSVSSEEGEDWPTSPVVPVYEEC